MMVKFMSGNDIVPLVNRIVKLGKVLQISKKQTSQIKLLYVDLDFL